MDSALGAAGASTTLSRTERLDRLPVTKAHTKLLTGSGIGWALDAMDVGLIGFIMAALTQHWGLSHTATSWIASVGFIGMALGATVGGLLADRFGRRHIFALTLLVYGLATGAAALSTGLAMLLVLRFIIGLGLGAELPVASTLVSEFSPRAVRGRMVVLLEAFWAVGWIAAAIIGTLVVPLGDDGWRWAFAIGVIPAAYALVVRLALPESVRFLESRGRHDEAEATVREFEVSEPGLAFLQARSTDRVLDEEQQDASILGQHITPEISPEQSATLCSEMLSEATGTVETTETAGTGHAKTSAVAPNHNSSEMIIAPPAPVTGIWSRPLRKRTAAFWTIWFCINLSYYGAFTWIPSILASNGYSLVKSFSFTLIITIAQLPGYACAAWLIEKWGRRITLTAFLVGSACAAGLYGLADAEWQIIAAGCLLSFFNLGAWGALYAVGPELYPTTLRATGTGAATGFGRIASIIAPLIVPPLLVFGGTGLLFALFGVAFAIGAAAAFTLPELRGTALVER